MWLVGVKLVGICFVRGSIRHSILRNYPILVGMCMAVVVVFCVA